MGYFSEIDSNKQNIVIKKVIELSWDGLGYKKIIKQIANDFDVKLSLGTLSYWFNNDVLLKGGLNKFNPISSKELSYVLGVMFGDGNLFFDKNKKDFVIRLDAIDKDFVIFFSKNVSKLLNKNKDYSVCAVKHKNMISIMYSTRARSKELYYFLKNLKVDFEKVKPFAEKFPKEFIQGLADSEGCPLISARKNFLVRVCVAVSTNKELLLFVKKLLWKKFFIKSNFYLSKKAGITDSIINGRSITRSKNLYALQISNFDNVKKFSKEIGFSIQRKNQKLFDAIFALSDTSVINPVTFWEYNYEKRSNQWFNKRRTKVR